MSLMDEYLKKPPSELENELISLIEKYNKIRGRYLFVYAASMEKPIPGSQMEQSDYYLFHDYLSCKDGVDKVDIYMETPGGSGETAEEIGNFLHKNFKTVSFVVSGEAKSAGTILALSGDEILMTDTGSLGPIDAQIIIGRARQSAHDYIEWVSEKRKEAREKGELNPFDATMIAQITPGELGGVLHSLRFAEDLVEDWLVRYKFKNWTVTETRGAPVTEELKKERASEIARQLTNHSRWRSHGRSIKIDDLSDLGLRVTRIDKDPALADVVYRIHTVCRFLFHSTHIFKIFATQDNKIFRHATPIEKPEQTPSHNNLGVVEINDKCPKCKKKYRIYGKLINDPKIDKDYQGRGFIPFPKDAILICECGHRIDLTETKEHIKQKTQRELIID